jgi:hypothetical protein
LVGAFKKTEKTAPSYVQPRTSTDLSLLIRHLTLRFETEKPYIARIETHLKSEGSGVLNSKINSVALCFKYCERKTTDDERCPKIGPDITSAKTGSEEELIRKTP